MKKLNREFVISMVKAYANNLNEITQEEFCNLFDVLSDAEFSEVIEIMADAGISVVEEKENIVDEWTGAVLADATHLSNEELCVMYQRGERSALDALVKNNSRLVYKIANKAVRDYKRSQLDIDDLYNTGNIGLIIAAEKFDLSKNTKFTTYACYWIKQQIVREIMNCGYTLRLPIHVFEKVIAVRRCRNINKPGNIYELQEYLRQEGRDYSISQIKQFIICGDKYLNINSLNDIITTDSSDDTEVISFVEANDDVEADVMKEQMANDVRKMLDTLTERERSIIIKRFGIGLRHSMTLEQIGTEFNITRERIRQIEAKALRKLKKSSRFAHMREYICA